MKSAIWICALCVSQLGIAQNLKDAEVPAQVKDAFTKAYPGVTARGWEKESDGSYEALISKGRGERCAIFSPDGILLAEEQEIDIKELPAPVTDILRQQYPDHKIEEASKMTPPQGEAFYEVEIEKGSEELVLHVNAQAMILKLFRKGD